MTAQSVVNPDGFNLNLRNNDPFTWDTLELNFLDGYHTDMHVTTPSNMGQTGQTGNTLYFTATPDVPNAGLLSQFPTAVIYEGPFGSVNFTEFTANPDIFGTLTLPYLRNSPELRSADL